MGSIKLDRTRKFGDTYPPVTHGDQVAHFCQDGFYFTVDGELVEGLLSKQDAARLERIQNEKKAEEAARDAGRKALEALGIDASEMDFKIKRTDPNAEPDDREDGEGKIDLLGWADGNKNYPWKAVQAEIKSRYGFAATTKASAKSFIDNGNKVL
jgi:hypothetical protein